MVLRFGEIHEGHSKANLAPLHPKMGLKSNGSYAETLSARVDRNQKLTGHEEPTAESRRVAAAMVPLTIHRRIEKTGAVYLFDR